MQAIVYKKRFENLAVLFKYRIHNSGNSWSLAPQFFMKYHFPIDYSFNAMFKYENILL